jgi:Tol biopolymer transport system component
MARGARPRSLAAALGLVLIVAVPVAGAPPQLTAPRSAGQTAKEPAVDIPAKPPHQAAPAMLAPPPGSTTLISITRTGGFGNGTSGGRPDNSSAGAGDLRAGGPSISANGRYVAFPSTASNLVAGDANRAMDIFVRDRRGGGATIRLPVPGAALPPIGGKAFQPSIAPDGSAVAFAYIAPPFVGTFVPACSGQSQIVLWTRATGVSTYVSALPGGKPACGASEPSVSDKGAFVAFTAVDTSSSDFGSVFIRDTAAATTQLASIPFDGGTADRDSFDPAISRDGLVVAFASDASDLIAADANKQRDVFAFDRSTGRVEPVSIGAGGPSDGPSENPAISANGNVIAFESRASNLIAGLTPSAQNVYVRDRQAGRTDIASVASGGGDGGGDSGQATISGDGRIVAFASAASNLVASADDAKLASLSEDTGGAFEVYAHDMITSQTIRISDAPTGSAGGGQSLRPAIGGNGRFVAFDSTSALLVGGDTNKARDVFLRDLPAAASLSPAVLEFGSRAIGVPGPPLAAILTNTGWGPLTAGAVARTGAAAADFAVALNACLGRSLRWLESCPITVEFTPTDRGDRVATLTVAHDASGSPATARLHGVGSRAELKLEPPIGQPGIVIIAIGSGFPANIDVSLRWSRGITQNRLTVTTDAAGGFRKQVLVYHNDIVGVRDLVASPVGSTVFTPFAAPFLVVEASSTPPRFIDRSPYDNRPPTLVMRR